MNPFQKTVLVPRVLTYEAARHLAYRDARLQVAKYAKTDGKYGQRVVGLATNKPSRTAPEAVRATLFVAAAEGKERGLNFPRSVLRKEAVQIAGNVKNMALLGGAKDDTQDYGLVPYKARTDDEITQRAILGEIISGNWVNPALAMEGRLISEDLPPDFDLVESLDVEGILLGAIMDNLNRSPVAKEEYLTAYDKLMERQALDLALAITLRKYLEIKIDPQLAVSEVQKLLMLKEGDYNHAVDACRMLPEKLSLEGHAIPRIVYAWLLELEDKDDPKFQEKAGPLSAIGESLTRGNQLIVDDFLGYADQANSKTGEVKKGDLTKLNPNPFALITAIDGPKYFAYADPKTTFFSEHRDLVDQWLLPVVQQMHVAADELVKLGFAGKDARLAVRKRVKDWKETIDELGPVNFRAHFTSGWYTWTKDYQKAHNWN